MKKTSTIKILLVLSLVLSGFTPLVFCAPGDTSADFLNMGVGARAIAMGGAFTGLADDVSAGYWNPSGLVNLRGPQFLTMYDALFEGMSHLYLGYGSKLRGGSALGVQINYFTTGSMDLSDLDGTKIGSTSAGNTAVILSYAVSVGESMSLGTNVKMITETLATYSGSGFGVDLGSLYRPSEKVNLGLTVQNLGTGIKIGSETSPLPMTARGGIGYSLDPNIKLCGDITFLQSDGIVGLSVGGEYKYQQMGLRLGITRTATGVRPSFGIGFDQGGFGMDLGMSVFEGLGTSFKVSLIGKFGSSENSTRPVKSGMRKASPDAEVSNSIKDM